MIKIKNESFLKFDDINTLETNTDLAELDKIAKLKKKFEKGEYRQEKSTEYYIGKMYKEGSYLFPSSWVVDTHKSENKYNIMKTDGSYEFLSPDLWFNLATNIDRRKRAINGYNCIWVDLPIEIQYIYDKNEKRASNNKSCSYAYNFISPVTGELLSPIWFIDVKGISAAAWVATYLPRVTYVDFANIYQNNIGNYYSSAKFAIDQDGNLFQRTCSDEKGLPMKKIKYEDLREIIGAELYDKLTTESIKKLLNTNSVNEKFLRFDDEDKESSEFKFGEIVKKYNYYPKTKEELRKILKKLIEERGPEGDFNDIYTGQITDMSELFKKCSDFNGNISNWDVSSVKDMSYMFFGCTSFNQDLSNWDVSNVENMSYMFAGCTSFNQDLSNWDVSSVKDMSYMFNLCESFNQDLSNWDVSSVKDMSYMFNLCESFNQDLSNWDVSNVKNMSFMFARCTSFNQDLSNWDVSNVVKMRYMFVGCSEKCTIPFWY